MTKYKYHTISSGATRPRRRRPIVPKFLKQPVVIDDNEEVKKCDSSASISSTDSNSYDWEERRKTISSNLKRKLGSGKKRPQSADAMVNDHSGVNMKEAFICSFPDGSEEVACAQRGRTLREMLSPIFDRRKLSMQEYAVFLQASNTPLSYSFDTHPLAGMTLNIQRDHYDATNEFTYKVKDNPTSLPRQKSRDHSARSLHDDLPDGPALAHQALSGEKNSFKRSNSLELDDSHTSGIRRTPSDRSADCDSDIVLREPSKKSCRGKKNLSLYLAGGEGEPKGVDEMDYKAKSITEQLERYGLYGLTQFDTQFENKREEFNIELESSWQDIVSIEAQNSLTNREKEQQEAIWELFSTEYNYLNNLSTCVKTFLNCLRKLKHEKFLSDINVEDLFLNIELIYEINLKFWKDCLEPCLIEARQTQNPLNPHLITEGYICDDRFYPYLEYCLKHQERIIYLDSKMKKQNDFKEYISWCENQLRSTTRLGLKDMLVKPFQRITKYPLLFKCILKKTQDEDTSTALKSMLDKIVSFVQSLNRQMQQKEDERSLKDVMSKIEGYNVFSPPTSTHGNERIDQILSQYNKLDLLSPVPVLGSQRRFLGESSSKMSTFQDRPFECHLFLFNDLLLITKPAKKRDKKYTIVKQPMSLDPDKLKITELEEHQNSILLVYLNEFGSAVDSFLLSSSSRESHLSFLNSISTAQDKFKEQKIKTLTEIDSSKSHLSNMSMESYTSSPDQNHLRLGCSITRSSSENYNRRTDTSTSVARAQSMPASNDRRLHNDPCLASSSSASSSETSGSLLSVDSSAKSSSVALSEIKENDYMASDLSIQNLDESGDENTVISDTKCESYTDNRTDNYISDNLCSDLKFKIDIDKTVLVDNDVKNQDIFNIGTEKL